MKTSLGIDPALALLLESAPGEVLDYGFVMHCLQNYQNPRVKLNHLLKLGALIRVKKGIYIFGKRFARHPFCAEVLANMIYGPSYVSLEWACQHYRLIPEKVTTVTSVTTKRSRQFSTPIGSFTYDRLHQAMYPVGITLVTFSDRQQALMATKEKALADLLVIRRGSMTSLKMVKETLFEDLRVEEEDFNTFDIHLLNQIYQAHPHRTIEFLIKLRNHD